jgi:hypothetical protein
MELLLNLTWFALAAAMLGGFAGRVLPDRKQFLLALAALGCALLLLFPAVSISDDLHRQPFFAEDSSAGKRLVSVAVHATRAYQLLWLGCSLPVGLLLRLQVRRLRCDGHETRYLVLLLDRSPLGRAPPASFLN